MESSKSEIDWIIKNLIWNDVHDIIPRRTKEPRYIRLIPGIGWYGTPSLYEKGTISDSLSVPDRVNF